MQTQKKIIDRFDSSSVCRVCINAVQNTNKDTNHLKNNRGKYLESCRFTIFPFTKGDSHHYFKSTWSLLDPLCRLPRVKRPTCTGSWSNMLNSENIKHSHAKFSSYVTISTFSSAYSPPWQLASESYLNWSHDLQAFHCHSRTAAVSCGVCRTLLYRVHVGDVHATTEWTCGTPKWYLVRLGRPFRAISAWRKSEWAGPGRLEIGFLPWGRQVCASILG